MRQFKRLSAVAIIVICLHSCKKEISHVEKENPPDFTTSAASMEASGESSEKAYVILCKNLDVSAELISEINVSGTVTASMNELGIVLANSSNPDFPATVMRQGEVLSVVPDIELNWQDPTLVHNEDQVSLDINDGGASEHLLNSGSIGLSGTNPLVPLQWNLKAVNAPAAFRAGYKGKGAVVAVLDNGFHLQNTDLSPNIIDITSFVPGEPAQLADPNTPSHGTAVAGIIAAADNNIGTVGIAPEASLVLVRVNGDNGRGQWGWLIQGVYYAATKGANIINMSLASITLIPRNGKIYDPEGNLISHDAKEVQDLINALNRAFQYASKKECTSIAAAGNDGLGLNGPGQGSVYPANCTNVIAVSSTGPLGWGVNQNTSLFPISFFTNYGIGFIDFSGPGGNIKFPRNETPVQVGPWIRPAVLFDQVLTPTRPNFWGFARGTSFATPAVSAVAAIIAGKYNGNISASQLQSKLKSSAIDLGEPGNDAFYGMGQVDAGLAIKQ